MSKKSDTRLTYKNIWNNYVQKGFPTIQKNAPFSQQQLEPWRVLNTKDEQYRWPGDEWGDQESAKRLFDESCSAFLDPDVRFLCELGSGAGRYTMLALEQFSSASILSFDVSEEFERILSQRCEKFVNSGRLRTYLLNSEPLFLYSTLKREKLIGKIDAIYSFDAMVHVDLHTIFIYWLTAASVLKTGGLLTMNVADACNEYGFMKLANDAPGVYPLGGRAGGHFMWLSQEIVGSVLERLGFETTFLQGNGRDLHISARLIDQDKAKAHFRQLISSTAAL